jgi:hypothetical protein
LTSHVKDHKRFLAQNIYFCPRFSRLEAENSPQSLLTMYSRLRLLILCLPFLLTFMQGCSSDPQKKGPQETAEAFLKAMQFGDFEKAKTFCSEGTAQNLTMVETMSKLGANPLKEDFEIKDVKEDGNYATVTYDQGTETGKILQLREDEGKWVVVMSKTDFGGGTKTDTDTPDNLSDENDKEEKVVPAIKYEAYREGKSAQQTAEAFMKALEFGNYDAAMRYGSQSTNDMLEYQKSMAALNDDKKTETQKVIKRVEEDGDFAKAYYVEEGKKDEKVLKLGKDDNGNWEVIMTKSEMEDAE